MESNKTTQTFYRFILKKTSIPMENIFICKSYLHDMYFPIELYHLIARVR